MVGHAPLSPPPLRSKGGFKALPPKENPQESVGLLIDLKI